MIDRKKAREITGLTHDALKSDSKAWFRLASSFNSAAKLLDEFSERIPSDSRPFIFNAAFSLELLFKSILAKKGIKIPQGTDGHDLKLLSKKAGVVISEKQALTLELMTEELIWVARYPTPKHPERFNKFYDSILERHLVRSRSGNVYRTLANPETFSNSENYKAIWDAAVIEFEK